MTLNFYYLRYSYNLNYQNDNKKNCFTVTITQLSVS